MPIPHGVKDAALSMAAGVKEKITGKPTVAPSTDYNTSYLTTNEGGPITDIEHTLTAGERGEDLGSYVSPPCDGSHDFLSFGQPETERLRRKQVWHVIFCVSNTYPPACVGR
jgi:hypothetical protein